MFSDLFTRILVPYDGSKYSKKSLQKAMEVGRNIDSEILILSVINVGHVSPPGSLLGLTKTRTEKETLKKITKSIKIQTEKMLQLAIEKCEKNNVSASYVIKEGNVANEILDFAKKKKTTLIIIGSQGLHGIEKLKSLGSVSRKVSELAHCPVLIIR